MKKTIIITESNISKAKFRTCIATPYPDHYKKSIINSIEFSSHEFDQLVEFMKQT